MTGQVKYLKENMIVTESLSVVVSDELIDVKKTENHRENFDANSILNNKND